MLAAVGQICSTASVAKNLLLCQSLIRRSSLAGVKLLYLPEASDFLAPPSEVGRLSSPVSNHPFLEGIKKYARQYSMWVGVGIHESVEGEEHKCYNTNVLIDSNGLVVSAYRKLHLFDVNIAGGATILESNTTVKGDKLLKPVDSPMGKIGLLTCYDLRFPEVSLMLRKAGAEIIVYPSAFTIKTGAAHWMILLRARAIETQCYILAPAQIGSHSPTRSSFGHSLIIDPWGTVIADGGDKVPLGLSSDEGTFVTCDIDLNYLKDLRQQIPLEAQRRNDVYNLSFMNMN